MPILSVWDLATAFLTPDGWKTVVDGVSFEIEEGQTLAVVGESGSGKSVTALSVIGLLPLATSRCTGQVLLDGRELLSLGESEMGKVRGNRIAMIFQESTSALNPVLSVARQIAEPLMRHRGLGHAAALREAVRLMDRVRIPAAARRAGDFPHEMSGGMLQRVMIATALACAPRLLIADEPTTALDVTVQAQILDLIKELQDEDRMAVLFITHDMGVVAEIAERTLVMFRSKIVESGTTEQIFAHPREAYTRRLLAATPRLGALRGTPLPQPYADAERPAEPRRDTVDRTGQPLLDVRRLTVRFDLRSGLFSQVSARVHAVENVSFEVRRGETLSLVGESGCGKSTTGRAILRLVEPVEGEVRLGGVDIRKLDPRALSRQRRSMQMIFQDPFSSLNPRMRVGEAIAEPIRAHRLMPDARIAGEVARLLEQVGLDPEMARRWPHEFSGGQRQRIAIARSLGLRPDFIVADESVSALDVTIKAQVVNLMMELQERLGLAYLFISHDMAVVERISHRVAVMHLGAIVEIGPRDSIFAHPAHPYTRRLLDAVPEPDPARRLARLRLETHEVKSPIFPPDYSPPAQRFTQVGEDHFVLQVAA